VAIIDGEGWQNIHESIVPALEQAHVSGSTRYTEYVQGAQVMALSFSMLRLLSRADANVQGYPITRPLLWSTSSIIASRIDTSPQVIVHRDCHIFASDHGPVMKLCRVSTMAKVQPQSFLLTESGETHKRRDGNLGVQ
jgi:hypothetical protein